MSEWDHMLQIDHSVRQLPAAAVAEELNRRLETGGRVVVTAPPGAGKSTVLPLTILESMASIPSTGKIIMLEPRRIAARQIAGRMAAWWGIGSVLRKRSADGHGSKW